MKTKLLIVGMILSLLPGITSMAQTDKYPGINLSGQIFDQYGNVLGWISKDGVVQNALDNKIAVIDKDGGAIDGHGQRIGRMNLDGAFHDAYGSLLFTLSPPRGHVCEMLDPQGNKIGLVHEHFRKQASAVIVMFAKAKHF